MKRHHPPLGKALLKFIRERCRKCRHPRDRARLRRQERRSRRAQAHAARADRGRHIERHRKRLHRPGTLPPVVLAEITGRDSDGELLARPTEWDEEAHGAPPVIRIVTPRQARPGEVAGVGDRTLLRIERTGDGETSGRVIKLIDRAKQRMLGVFRGLPNGGGRLVPIDKKARPRNAIASATMRRRRGQRSRRRRSVRATAGSGCRSARSSSGSARSRASAPSA